MSGGKRKVLRIKNPLHMQGILIFSWQLPLVYLFIRGKESKQSACCHSLLPWGISLSISSKSCKLPEITSPLMPLCKLRISPAEAGYCRTPTTQFPSVKEDIGAFVKP